MKTASVAVKESVQLGQTSLGRGAVCEIEKKGKVLDEDEVGFVGKI